MRAVVVGAGIGGLAAAIALRKIGVETRVIEQSGQLSEIGAGITLFPNAMKALHYLGADEHVSRRGVMCQEDLYFDLVSGERIARRQLLGWEAAKIYGAYGYLAHRADLLDALLNVVSGDVITLGHRVTDVIYDSAQTAVCLDNGDRWTSDVVIVADGIRSSLREVLFGRRPVIGTGIRGWRSLVPRSRLPRTLPKSVGVDSWLGPTLSVTSYPVRRDLAYVGAFLPAHELAEPETAWTTQGAVEDMRRYFRNACSDVEALFDAIEAHAPPPVLTSIEFMEPLESWRRGRVVLLGDAAHPITPSIGQGAALALEDAVTLAECLRGAGGGRIDEALADYERRRMPRARRALSVALAMHAITRADDSVLVRARDGRLRGLERLDPTGFTTYGWINSYDPADGARPATRRQEDGARSAWSHEAARTAFDLWSTAVTERDSQDNWMGERAAYDRFVSGLTEVLPEPAVTTRSYGGRPALQVGGGHSLTVFYLHGGGYSYGSAAASTGVCQRIASRLHATVVIPDYRLAPEHPYPAALSDVCAAYQDLARTLPADHPIVVCGDCAGAGLAIALAVHVRDGRGKTPLLLSLVSPFADLALSSARLESNGVADPWLNRARLTALAASYVQDANPCDPAVSPLYADLAGLPPLHIEVAEDEALADDALRLAESAAQRDIQVWLHRIPVSVHSFSLFSFLPESGDYLNRLTEAIKEVGGLWSA